MSSAIDKTGRIIGQFTNSDAGVADSAQVLYDFKEKDSENEDSKNGDYRLVLYDNNEWVSIRYNDFVWRGTYETSNSRVDNSTTYTLKRVATYRQFCTTHRDGSESCCIYSGYPRNNRYPYRSNSSYLIDENAYPNYVNYIDTTRDTFDYTGYENKIIKFLSDHNISCRELSIVENVGKGKGEGEPYSSYRERDYKCWSLKYSDGHSVKDTVLKRKEMPNSDWEDLPTTFSLVVGVDGNPVDSNNFWREFDRGFFDWWEVYLGEVESYYPE